MTKLSAEGGGMRIIAGQFRGRKLFSPIKSGIRPTTDAVRESIFNILYSASGLLPEPEYQNILDLFAGTGAMGLEALSRNAARALFVDNNPEAHAIIYKNIAMLGVADHAKIYRRSALKLDQWRELYRFNMVFVDPPYYKNCVKPALLSAEKSGWLDHNAVIVCETASDETLELPSAFKESKVRIYGRTKIAVYVYKP